MAATKPSNIKIIHILKDGTVVDSIEGHVVRFEDAEEMYRMIANMGTKRRRTINDKNVL